LKTPGSGILSPHPRPAGDEKCKESLLRKRPVQSGRSIDALLTTVRTVRFASRLHPAQFRHWRVQGYGAKQSRTTRFQLKGFPSIWLNRRRVSPASSTPPLSATGGVEVTEPSIQPRKYVCILFINKTREPFSIKKASLGFLLQNFWGSNEGAAAPSFVIDSSGFAGGAGRLRSKLSLRDFLAVSAG
jgi:hypothetical protein